MRAHAHTCTCTRTHTHTHTHSHSHSHLHTHTYTHTHTPLFTHTDSLSRVIRNVCCDGVCSLYSNKEEWGRLVMPNVRHIIGGVLRGTAYLHDDMCIQHVDLKGTYIVHDTCTCVYMYTFFKVHSLSLSTVRIRYIVSHFERA